MAWLSTTISVQESGRFSAAGLAGAVEAGWLGPEEPGDLGEVFSEIRSQIVEETQAAFRVIVVGAARVLRPQASDAVYWVGHEALSNAFRHSRAKDIEVEVEYAANHLRVLVRDNGCGIDGKALDARHDRQSGLRMMKGRAERVEGRLRVLSHPSAGTEIELSIPARVAFASVSQRQPVGWLSRLFS